MRSIHVVALEVPIVYNLDGDHDPDGMLFAMAGHRPILEWLVERWEDGDKRLPRLHHRRQRAQLVVDGLARLEDVLDGLRHGPDDDQELLAELLRREHVPEYGAQEDRLSTGPRRRGGRSGAVRTNVQQLLDELRVSLADLGHRDPREQATDTTDTTDAPFGEPPPIRLVSLSTTRRRALRRHWRTQLAHLDRALARWHADCAADPQRRYDAGALAAACRAAAGVTGEDPLMGARHVDALMLNARTLGASAYSRVDPMRPLPVVAPLVLRAHRGEQVHVQVENGLSDRLLTPHVQGLGLTPVGGDESPLLPGETRIFELSTEHEGVWPLNDVADVRGSQAGTNSHGLFGVVVVEPEGVRWHDPVTGDDLTDSLWGSGLYADIHVPGESWEPGQEYVDLHSDRLGQTATRPELDRSGLRSHREFVTFIHDEPEIHSGLHTGGEHTVMPLSYRAEPMHNRVPHRMRRYAEQTAARYPHDDGHGLPSDQSVAVDRRAVTMAVGPDLQEEFWTARTADGRYLERVSGEEQHHSSWLFGDPATPIFRAYRGDPCRVRLVHAGVKETHVWHLHVHQWRLVPHDTAVPSVHGTDEHGRPRAKGSQLVDAVTISPQTGMTIDPLYGSGSRQHAAGDIIWHCHLYPHFHHGMWGLWRSYDRLVDGSRPYPDGTPCPALKPLPGLTPEAPTPQLPGFPWFIDGACPMKSPPPPVGSSALMNGRRRLLGMQPCSTTERAAMSPACRDGAYPGATFVDLDGLAHTWNKKAGLPPPRTISYEVEVRADRVRYNVDGWQDPRGHHYRLLSATVTDADGTVLATEILDAAPGNPEPFYPRANHGDIVEWRFSNALNSFPADDFDLAQHPVECGLHVHLVKFDVLASDGSATGWNYLSGGSCRESVGSDHPGLQRTTSLHRWVVDEEFGPCFFHDHLLANYRQKHGLYAALIAEPHGSQWHRTDNQSRTAWSEPQAVVVPPAAAGLPAYREACLGIGDFVPLLDRAGRPLNPPSTLSGDDDPGSMGVNYRSAPLTFRGRDPSLWFSTRARSQASFRGDPGDPDTPLVELYPGERLRIRLVQGSHEEQHSFMAFGLRWRRDWGNPLSPLANQQTVGISEAFTLDVDPAGDSPFGSGDHLWMFTPMDDLWTGCWGYVRVLRPTADHLERLAPLPDHDPATALERMRRARAVPPHPVASDPQVRTHVVVARRTEHRYAGHLLTDPWGLVYRTADHDPAEEEKARKTGVWAPQHLHPLDGPLVLRARRGEWVRVVLVNELLREDPEPWCDALPPFDVESSPPRLPLEHLDEQGHPDQRWVSPRVSLHAALVRYEVTGSDGAAVGRNPDQTVGHLPLREHDGGHEGGGRVVLRGHDGESGHSHDEPNWREYWWHADEALAPAHAADGPGQVCHLQDLADVRNHRHHGLVGALVVLPGDVTPYRPDAADVREGAATEAWSGTRAVLRPTDPGTSAAPGAPPVATETVAFVQDSLRLFVNGHPDLPVVDIVPLDDPEDSGHKAISYRTGAVHRGRVPAPQDRPPPLLTAAAGSRVWLRVVGRRRQAAAALPRAARARLAAGGARAAGSVGRLSGRDHGGLDERPRSDRGSVGPPPAALRRVPVGHRTRRVGRHRGHRPPGSLGSTGTPAGPETEAPQEGATHEHGARCGVLGALTGGPSTRSPPARTARARGSSTRIRPRRMVSSPSLSAALSTWFTVGRVVPAMQASTSCDSGTTVPRPPSPYS